MNYFSNYLGLSTKEKKLFLEAVFFLFLSKALLILPFRICMKTMKSPELFKAFADVTVLEAIKTAVYRANMLACWHNICLVKSMAARFMLQRRKIDSTFYLGLRKNKSEKMAAHAWVTSGGFQVTPKGEVDQVEIFAF
jgi:hypothetical protein